MLSMVQSKSITRRTFKANFVLAIVLLALGLITVAIIILKMHTTVVVLPDFLSDGSGICTGSALQPRLATTKELLDDPLARKIVNELRENYRPHRKLWEFVFIVKALEELDMLAKGRRGLVFAAGREPLISYFASRGVEIVATDMDPESAFKLGWTMTNQHAKNVSSLLYSNIVSSEQFQRLVSYRRADMNVVYPEFVGKFDFVWSTCSLEHVGSISLGQRFALNSLDYLKPGGAAVHTTEFTLSSLQRTVERGGTVLWRKRDMETLHDDLVELGYTIEPICWDAGNRHLDVSPDVPPYSADRHMKLLLMEHVATSIGWVSLKPRLSRAIESAGKRK